MNGLVATLAVLAAGYLALAAFAYFNQSNLLYLRDMPSREVLATPQEVGLHYESVRIVTADRETLDAWFLPARPERLVLLFFHGNAGNISHRLESLRIFHALGLSVLIFDYRGYGRSTGTPTEDGTYRDALAAWDHLTRDRGIGARRIVLFGRSLGGAVAAWLATQRAPRALIVESSFTSAPDLAAQVYPFLPARWLTRFRYPTAEYLRAIRCPVLVVHSRDDEIIPYSHGESLYAAARPPKQMLTLRGGHNDAFVSSGRTYIDGLAGFLGETGIEAGAGRGE